MGGDTDFHPFFGDGGDGDFDVAGANLYCLYFDQNSLASLGDLSDSEEVPNKARRGFRVKYLMKLEEILK